MTTTEQPAPQSIIPARLAELLQRAMFWRFGASATTPRQDEAQTTVEAAVADIGEREGLPWWVAHHPAVSFRGPRQEETRD